MRILCIDDDYVSRLKLKSVLSQYGDCDVAPSGELALELINHAHIEGFPYEMVMLDIDMPTMKGPEVVKSIREYEEKKDICISDAGVKIIMITGTRDAVSIASSMVKGAQTFMLKPATKDKIEEKMKELGLITL